MEVIQAEFARMAGVSKAAVCTKIKDKTLILNSGGMLDTDNPVNHAYLERKQAAFIHRQAVQKLSVPSSPAASATAPSASVPSRAPLISPGAAAAVIRADGQAREIMNLTLREIIERFGTIQDADKYAKTLKSLIDADARELDVKTQRKEVIPREFVEARLFSLINQLLHNLNDYADGSSDRMVAVIQSDPVNAQEKIASILRIDMAKYLQDAKDSLLQEL